MKDGKLSKREMETINKAHDILNALVDWIDDQDGDLPDGHDDAYLAACGAVCRLTDFLSWYEG